MNVNAAHSSSSSGSTTGLPVSSAQDTNDMFLQLLTAQLKFQDPIDPVDPNQFVGQLVQFNTLDQLIQIREMVQQAVQGTGSETTSAQGA